MLADAAQKVCSRFEFFPPRRVYAPRALHAEILGRFGYRGGLFFEAGANDGLQQSNTAYLGRHLDWSGILVEPIPHKAASCRRNRPDARTVEAALVPSGYHQPTIEMTFSNLMSLSELSDIPLAAHLAASRLHIGAEVAMLGQRFTVPARTAQSVIDEAGNPAIDLFILDVEGAERSVLEGIDFARTRPVHMLVEVRDMGRIGPFLAERGYASPERLSELDYLFAAH